MFLSNPRGWAPSPGRPDDVRAFRDRTGELGIPVFAHAPYLVNVGSPDEATLRNSLAAVRHALRRGADVGARGVVVHTGSAITAANRTAALAQVRRELRALLDELPEEGPDLLLEPTAGGGQPLCARVEDLAEYLAALDDHPRVGVCLDVCHAFAAGHDLASPGGARRTLRTLARVAGKGRLRLVHANDSKDPLGSCRDRHEMIGKGTVGEAAFAELLASPAARGVPFVIETPGDPDDDRANIDLLKRLRG